MPKSKTIVNKKGSSVVPSQHKEAYMSQRQVPVQSDPWMLLPPSGTLAILRRPALAVPEGCRLATPHELFAANQGSPFPWGSYPDSSRANGYWKKHRMGIGGLIHDRWFMTSGGRFGGAPNVPETQPGSLRCCMLLDGGGSVAPGRLEENEGYAVVSETTEEDQAMYRRVQLCAAEHVVADGGAIIVSPVYRENTVFVGFVGRCLICPNQGISIRALQMVVPEYRFEFWSEWQG